MAQTLVVKLQALEMGPRLMDSAFSKSRVTAHGGAGSPDRGI